jgi:thiol-disulfide isomerase/thioredoxin
MAGPVLSHCQLAQRAALFVLLAFVCVRAGSAAPGVRIVQWSGSALAPPLPTTAVNGGESSLSDLHGKVVVLNFWASWCEPCISELDSLEALASSGLAAGGLAILGVNYMESADAIRRVLERALIAFPVLQDRDGSAFRAWTSGILPTSVLVDRKGRPRIRIDGELDWTGPDARHLLQGLLDER